ncbi:hypothetical protein NE237_002461 [Protea cynaroides]|uniref:RNase H type-1 domain-containing protein n=1 Tax=Protea cynaroides TaxID=273540 RepID=A0A9Q0QZH4_9MAGN|nr:hypothetical protein NE237_002461 [Protea cynaroides]
MKAIHGRFSLSSSSSLAKPDLNSIDSIVKNQQKEIHMKGTKNGIFSVKSAYHMLANLKEAGLSVSFDFQMCTMEKAITLAYGAAASQLEAPCHWIPPPPVCSKLNVDAALSSDISQSGIGFVIRTARGDLVMQVSWDIPFIKVDLGEALAVQAGVQEAVANGTPI